MKKETIRLIESIQSNLKENINTVPDVFDSIDEIKSKFENPEIFTKIKYIGDGRNRQCKSNTLNAYRADKSQIPYYGYYVLEEDNKYYGIKHYFNVQGDTVIEYSPIRDSAQYKMYNFIMYIGGKINA